jgi:hypothetical protein
VSLSYRENDADALDVIRAHKKSTRIFREKNF